MRQAVAAMLFLVALAVGCVLYFDSLFIDVGAAIIVTLIGLLIPVILVCRGRQGPK